MYTVNVHSLSISSNGGGNSAWRAISQTVCYAKHVAIYILASGNYNPDKEYQQCFILIKCSHAGCIDIYVVNKAKVSA